MKAKRRILRRHAIAMSGCMDVADLAPYQHGRHSRSGVTVYDFGDGYAVALNEGEAVPGWLGEFGEWSLREKVGGWAVWTAGVSK